MADQSPEPSRRHWARAALLLLLVIPFLPELAICAVAALAYFTGCRVDQESPCIVSSLPASEVIDWALWLGGVDIVGSAARRSYFHLILGAWLFVCYVVLIFAWTRLQTRLVIGAAITLVLAVLPYWAPLWTVRMFADERLCKPQSTGCPLFGKKVEKAFAALNMQDLPAHDSGPLLALGMFVAFAVFVAARAGFVARREGRSRSSR
ncbi:hypothetical protein IVB18_21730 [Bradyrhizobium sp. 186]|uniref:hypothetical protein n=1 Tax=Bradyrhizobium sp. 186 TaxID=2782654 RepID=UPI0020008E8A|nr:hypothetical protein [Bradyrhizobium sp. 186]UPK39610.1 hypothetical protein IVB18_21730 [Bradyrhizobium sp. 186]